MEIADMDRVKYRSLEDDHAFWKCRTLVKICFVISIGLEQLMFYTTGDSEQRMYVYPGEQS
jgi:hypothetical protein